uniref:Uncharacterized protein n=1 Tax=Arundo donax TaxID=35708 RepID=A0A0A8YIT3_ARUDO
MVTHYLRQASESPDRQNICRNVTIRTKSCCYPQGSYPTTCASRANWHGPLPSTTQKIKSGSSAFCLSGLPPYAGFKDQHWHWRHLVEALVRH